MARKKIKRTITRKKAAPSLRIPHVVLFGIALVLGILLLSRHNQETTSNKESKRVISTPTPTIVPPKKTLEDWEIQYNDVFSVQYPTTYTLTSVNLNTSFDLVDKNEYSKDKDFFDRGWWAPKIGHVSFSVLDIDNTTLGLYNEYDKDVSEEDFYDQTSTFWKNLPKQSGNGGLREFKQELTKVGEYQAIKETTISRQGVESDDEDTYSYYIYVPWLNSKVIKASYSINPHSQSFQQYVPTIEQIISTLRFTR